MWKWFLVFINEIVFQEKEPAEKDKEAIIENGVSDNEEKTDKSADGEAPVASEEGEKVEKADGVAEKTTEGTAEKSGDEAEAKVEESGKKKKKDKPKKKWSFRSISFSKKDKSKPAKEGDKNGEVKELPEEVGYRLCNLLWSAN